MSQCDYRKPSAFCNRTVTFSIFSSLWARRPGDRDTSHSWGRRGATALAFCNLDRQPAAGWSGDDVIDDYHDDHAKCVVLVALPYDFFSSFSISSFSGNR